MGAVVHSNDSDYGKVGQLLNFRIHNITTSDRTTLGGSLSSANKGLPVWDTDLEQNFIWTGTAWKAAGSVSNPMSYEGGHSSLTTAPASPSQGSTYVMTTAGTLTWAGQTFSPSAVVAIGDMVIYRGSNTWDTYEGNAQLSSETVAGLIEIATQTEVNTGTDDQRAVTPAKLLSWNNTKKHARTYFNPSVNVVAGTPLTITHNLGLSNKDAFVMRVCDSSGSEISIDNDSVNTNELTLSSLIAWSDLKVCIVGF